MDYEYLRDLYSLLVDIKSLLKDIANNNAREIFDRDQACEYLGIGKTMLSKYISDGEIRYRKNGSSYLFKKTWLDEWMEMDSVSDSAEVIYMEVKRNEKIL